MAGTRGQVVAAVDERGGGLQRAQARPTETQLTSTRGQSAATETQITATRGQSAITVTGLTATRGQGRLILGQKRLILGQGLLIMLLAAAARAWAALAALLRLRHSPGATSKASVSGRKRISA